jgi:hypothetical protein
MKAMAPSQSRSETHTDVTNVNYAGPREAKNRLDRLKCSNILDLVAFMHDPSQGRTGMKIEFGTPDSPSPQFTSVEPSASRLTINIQGSRHSSPAIKFMEIVDGTSREFSWKPLVEDIQCTVVTREEYCLYSWSLLSKS